MKSSGIKQRSTRKWTVVIVRRFGKISSHEISGFWFKALVFILIVILAGSGYLFYENRKLSAERQRLLAKLVLPPSEMETDKPLVREPETSTTVPGKEPAALTTTTTTLKKVATTAAPSTTTTTEAEAEATTTQAPETPTTTLPQTDESAVESEKVGVDDVQVVNLPRNRGIKIAYKLVNKGRGGKKITGYTFALAKNTESSQTLVESFPKSVTLEEEMPVDHKRGVAFSIYQFKTIRGTISTKEKVTEVVILVYDQAGELLIKKTYPVPSA